MALDTDGIGDDFNRSLQTNPLFAAPQETGLIDRALGYAGTLPVRVASNITAQVGNLFGVDSEGAGFLNDVGPTPATSTAGKWVDVLGGGVAPAIAEMALLGRATGPLTGTIANPLLRRVATDAIGFGALGLQEDRVTGAEQTAEGAALGALSGLGRVARLPLAALLGIGSKAFFDWRNPTPVIGDWTRGDIGGLSNVVGSLLPGRVPFRTPARPTFEGLTRPPRQGPWTPDGFQAEPSPYEFIGPLEHQGPVWEPQPPSADQLLGIRPADAVYTRQMREQTYGSIFNPPEVGTTPEQLFGLQALQNYSAADSAAFIQAQRAARDKVVALDVFRDNRVIATKYTPPELRTRPIVDIEGTVLPPQGNPAALVKSSAQPNLSMLFDPAENQWFQQAFQQSVDNPEIQNALVRLKLSVAQAMVRSDRRQAQIAFAKFFEEVGHRPNVDALSQQSALAGEDVWAAIIGRPVAPEGPPMLMNPLPEGDPSVLGGRAPQPKVLSQAEEQILGMQRSQREAEEAAATQRLNEEKTRRQIELARKSRIPDLPEYRRTEGGFLADSDVMSALGWAAARGLAGGLVGGLQDADDDGTRLGNMLAVGASAAIAPYIPQLVRMLQKMERGGYSRPTSVEPPTARALIPQQKGGVASPFPQAAVKANSLQALQNQGGFVLPELSAALGRGIVGGALGSFTGGTQDDIGDHTKFIAGGILGAAAFVAGPAIARSLLSGFADLKLPKAPKAGWSDAVRNIDAKIEEAAGATFSGSTKIADRFIRWADSGFGLTMPVEVKEAMLRARGAGSVLLDQVDSALTNIALRFSPDDVVKKLTNQFLDGKFTGGVQEYLQAMQPHINGNASVGQYAKFAIAARESMNGLQEMLMSGIKDPKKRAIVKDSLGRYVTRSYRIFTDPRWQPDEKSIMNLATEMAGKTRSDGTPLMGTANVGDLVRALRQHVREIKSAKGVYVPTSPTGEAINQSLFKERVDLSAAWKQFLGEITDPTERVYQTIFRLRPMAEASQFFASVANVVEDGMPHVFDSTESLGTFRTKLQQQLQSLGGPEGTHADVPRLNKQLASLDSFQYVPDVDKFGELGNKIVSRHVWDTLSTFDSMTNIASHPWLRAMSNIHTAIKLTRTAMSPITVVRNIVTQPFFMAIGKSDIQGIREAWDIIHNQSHPLRNEIMLQGIGNVDQVKTEFFKEFDALTGAKFNFGTLDGANLGMGRLDLDFAERAVKRGIRTGLDFYRLPDNLTRISSYLAAKRRIAQELGLALDNPEVMKQAARFTNRYTMNYDALPPAIKGLRQVPLVNLFLSYTAEIARIGKNLFEDVVKGDGLPGGGKDMTRNSRMFALSMLGSLAVLPELMQSSSEANLSDKDRADWEQAKKLMPEYARTRYYFNIRRDPKTKQFEYLDFTSLIPSDSYNQMVRAVKGQDWQALAAINPVVGWDNTPILNIAITQATGEDQRRGRKLRGAADRFASVATELAPPWFPGVGSEAQKFQLAYTTNAQGERGLTNARTGARITPSEFWVPYYSGLRPSSLNLSVLAQRFESQAKQDVANEIAYANDVIKHKDIPEDVKQRVLERTTKALEAIRARYAEQMQRVP